VARRHDLGHLPAQADALEIGKDHDPVLAARARRPLAGAHFPKRGLHGVEADRAPVQRDLEAPGRLTHAPAEVVVLLERGIMIVRRPPHLERHLGRLEEVALLAHRRGRGDAVCAEHHETPVAHGARGLEGATPGVLPARGRYGGRE